LDYTFKPDGTKGGTYYRKIEDIQRGLDELGVEKLPEPTRFVALFFGCEKLAKMMAGIHLNRNANVATKGRLEIDELRAAVAALNINFHPADIDELFLSGSKGMSIESGRALRHRLNHEFGPTIVKRVRDRAPRLTPLARRFLSTSSAVLACLYRRWP
jgi:hypothetical protein